MVDIFNEVEEELRRDRAASLWKKYGNIIIGIALAIVVGVAGWRFYETNRARERAALASQFEAAISELTRENSPSQAALAALSASKQGIYPQLARFRLASEKARTASDPASRTEVAAIFDSLAEDPALPQEWRALATLRAAYLLIDDSNVSTIEAKVRPFLNESSAFRHSAREVVALAAWRTAQQAPAQDAAQALVLDPQTPNGLRQRAQLLLEILQAGQPEP